MELKVFLGVTVRIVMFSSLIKIAKNDYFVPVFHPI